MICTNIKYPRIVRVAKGENIVTYEIKSSDIRMDSINACNSRGSNSMLSNNEGVMLSDSGDVIPIPYINNALSEALTVRGNLENLILVAQSEPIAVKCAAFLLENEPLIMANRKCSELEEKENTNDPYGIYDDFQYEYEEHDYALRLVHLPDGQAIKEAPINMCLSLLRDVEGDAVIYEGFEINEDITDKIEAVLADERQRKYIWITPSQIKESWVNKLRTDFGYSMLQIEDVPCAYYEDVFSMLIKETGYELTTGNTAWGIVNQLMKQFGNDFSEEKIEWMIQQAVHEKARRNEKDNTLSKADFSLFAISEKSAFDKLSKMPGLGEMKEVILEQTALRKEIRRNPHLQGNHNHMIFYGNPGTGKTTCARLMADIMADNGVKNSVFVEATRSDIIGQYVGHTAKKISDLFEKARGGILFVDESGFFLNTGAGGFVTEAIKEFVRFMENCPDVMVVFAMYEKEAEAFLKLDEGLASRISRMVDFRDYSHSELSDIFGYMVKENGYQIRKDAIAAFGEYIDIRKQDKNFGNAREVRKVFESTVVQHSVRILNSDNQTDILTLDDVKNGISKLRKIPKTRKDFGFQYSSITSGNLAINN